MEETIQVINKNIFIVRIKDRNGNLTGDTIEINMDDIEMPLKLHKSELEHNKNINWLKIQLTSLEKKEDKKGKYLLSWKEEETTKIWVEFLKREMECFDLIYGANTCKKLLAGQDPYYEMFEDFTKALEPINKKIEEIVANSNNIIKEKYKDVIENANLSLEEINNSKNNKEVIDSVR